MPTSILNWKSPHEILHGKIPDHSKLRTFGCLYFAAHIGPHRDKFDTRAIKCLFLGYVVSHKVDKVMNLASHKVVVSRNI